MSIEITSPHLAGVMIAALGGAAVGLERQWSGHAEGPDARFAGIRTFAMLGGVGGLCGFLWTVGVTAPAAILLAGAVAIATAAYIMGSRRDIDGTTEVAAVVVLGVGLMAGIGLVAFASGTISILVLLLVEKSRLHALVRRIDDVELRSAVRFAVMALVVLPLLPVGPLGPFGGVRPRQLWMLVLFFSGLSFVGYLARRLIGSRGYVIAGMLGGLVSSTNVTLTFARMSGRDVSLQTPLAFGTVAASAALFPRVLLATAILNPAVVGRLALYLAAPALVAILMTVAGVRWSKSIVASDPLPRNPLQLNAAVQMAALFQVVLMGVYIARERWGGSGILTSAAILGLTDVDALTVSMSTDVAYAVSASAAALAIGTGILSNTAMKLLLALVFGGSRFRMIAGGALALILFALAFSLVLLGR